MNVAEAIRLTPDDLLQRPDDGHVYELVDGDLVELSMSGETSWIAGELLYLIRQVKDIQKQGWLFPVDAGFRGFPEDPDMVRKPDLAFVRRERLPVISPEGFIPLIPDLVVEVVSPHDLAYEVEAKTRLWLSAGCQTVWVVMPRSQTVTVYQAGQKPVLLSADDMLTHPTLLPGFACRVGELFPPQSGVNTSAISSAKP